MGETMLDRMAECAKRFGSEDAMFEFVLTPDDNVELLSELSDYFGGDSDFDEDVFNLLHKWVKKYVEEMD